MQMKRFIVYTLAVVLAAGLLPAQEEPTLPEDIQWETNMDDPPIGSPEAKKGGTLTSYLSGFPKTFRLYGPNANEAFANWSRPTSMDIALTMLHPTTDNFVPILATHWAVMDDHKTVYYKLNEDARWSDGEPITADDFVYAYEFLSSPLIRDPNMNQLMDDYYESVTKIDDYTIRIVGKNESWRPLYDYNLSPVPEHATNLTETWVEEANYEPPVVQGPYTISDYKIGELVVLERDPEWWGYDHKYFEGVFNVDRIKLIMIADAERAFDYFKKGRIDFYQIGSSRLWETQMDLEEFDKGWMHRKLVFNQQPQGLYGMIMNLNTPLLQNKDFRKALQYLFHFDELNQELMYGAYYRSVSAFEGTEYENEELEPYGFNPRKAVEHLKAAGFGKRGNDGIRVNEQGQRASLTLTYGAPTFTRHLTVIQNVYKRAGVELQLNMVEPVSYFEKLREKAFEVSMVSMTGGFYPDPYQYFHSDGKDKPQTNNFFNFGGADTDELIDTYRFSMDEEERLSAMKELDRIIQEEAFYIPFWTAPYIRLAYWDYVRFPDFYLPKRAQSMMEYQVWWVEPEQRKRVEEAMANGTALEPSRQIEVDPYGVKEDLEEAADAKEEATE